MSVAQTLFLDVSLLTPAEFLELQRRAKLAFALELQKFFLETKGPGSFEIAEDYFEPETATKFEVKAKEGEEVEVIFRSTDTQPPESEHSQPKETLN